MMLDSYVNQNYLVAHPVPPEGRIMIVTARWRGLRWTLRRQVISSPDENAAAYGEVVWSWRRDRGVKLAGVSRRRRWQKTPLTGESTYKP
jgi:hypothetical protein